MSCHSIMVKHPQAALHAKHKRLRAAKKRPMGSKMESLASVSKSSNNSGWVKYLNQRLQCFSSRPSLRGSWKKVPLSLPMEHTWACSTTSNDTEIMLCNQADKGCPALSTPWTMFQEEKSQNVVLKYAVRIPEVWEQQYSEFAFGLGELERANGWVLQQQWTTYIILAVVEVPRKINKVGKMKKTRGQ